MEEDSNESVEYAIVEKDFYMHIVDEAILKFFEKKRIKKKKKSALVAISNLINNVILKKKIKNLIKNTILYLIDSYLSVERIKDIMYNLLNNYTDKYNILNDYYLSN
jgi:hypothetical protein